MKEEKQHIDDLFREGLKDFKQNPPPYIFDNIREKLDNQRKKKGLFFVRSIAAAAIILIAFGTGYLLKQKQVQQQFSYDQEKIPEEKTVSSDKESGVIDAGNTQTEILIARQSEIIERPLNTIDNLTYTRNARKELIEEKKTTVSNKVHLKKHHRIIASLISNTDFTGSEQAKPDLSSAQLNIKSISSDLTDDNTTNNNTNKWSVTGQISPSYSYKSSPTGMMNADAMEYDSPGGSAGNYQENAIVSFSGGMQMSYELNSNWEIASGLYYSLNGVNTKDFFSANSGFYAINSSMLNNSIGSIQFTDSPMGLLDSETGKRSYDEFMSYEESSDLIQHFEYIEVPFLIKRKLIDKKIGVHLLTGLRTGLLIGNKAFYSFSGKSENIGSTYGISNISFNGILGFGLSFTLSRKISLNFEPSFKYSLRKVNTGPENYYPWTIDLFSGIVYNF